MRFAGAWIRHGGFTALFTSAKRTGPNPSRRVCTRSIFVLIRSLRDSPRPYIHDPPSRESDRVNVAV